MNSMKRMRKSFLAVGTACALLASGAGVLCGTALKASATNSSAQLQTQIDAKQEEIDAASAQLQSIRDRISEMETEADLIEEQRVGLEAELVNLMVDIDLTEAAIEAKESELEEIGYEIEQTRGEYDDAAAREEQQYREMVVRIRTMYEKGDPDLLALLFAGSGLSELLRRMDLVEKLYDYDRGKLDEYTATKEEVAALAQRLAEEQERLEEEKAALDAQMASLEDEREALSEVQEQLKEQADNYDSLIKKATQQAAVASGLLWQEQTALQGLQDEQREAIARERAAEAAAAAAAAQQSETDGGTEQPGGTGGNSAAGGGEAPGGAGQPGGEAEGNNASGGTSAPSGSTGYDSIIDAANGSDLGKQIAKYACQFIGNPYVYGGTSLTNGADCSGFTMRIYADYGYSIPRSSYSQQSAGTAVSYADAQPGDIICYSGHVAIYIGNGLIVHASTPKGGIKVGNAAYTTIVTVRRIVN